eukprot:1779909-Prymnesium_polylepis.1
MCDQSRDRGPAMWREGRGENIRGSCARRESRSVQVHALSSRVRLWRSLLFRPRRSQRPVGVGRDCLDRRDRGRATDVYTLHKAYRLVELSR